MIGAAMANAGQGLVQAAFNLNDLREQENADKLNDRANEVSTSLTRFMDEEEKTFLKAREEGSESGIGFTRQFIEGHQQRANEFAKANFEGLSKDAQTGYLNNIISRGNSLFEKATAYENETKASYYDRSTNQSLGTFRTQIQNNAAGFDDLKRQGLEAIDATNMPEPWKAERRAQWDADAAESKWRWEYQQNPAKAVQEIRGQPAGGDRIDKIIGVESGGKADAKNPNSSATGGGQFITSTWMDMVKRRRPDLLEGRSTAEVLALRNDMGLSREMTGYLAEENSEFLRNQGLQDTDGNVYLAHFLGPRGASQVLKADPSTPISDIVGQDAVNANPFLKGKTAADVVAWSDKKMGGGGVSTGGAPSPAYQSIPFERREQLAAWGETEYSQQVTKQRAATKDGYSLLIATQPEQMRESVILNDTTLDDGDKATLVTSLRTALKETAGVNQMIGAMAAGGVSVNPFDNEQTKVADKAYDKLVGATADDTERQVVTSDFVSRTGYIPKPVQAELRRATVSNDPAAVAQGMEAAIVLAKNAPTGFNFEGAASVRDKMDLYRSFTRDMGYSPEDAAKRLIDASDPAKASVRKALLDSDKVKNAIKSIDAGKVAAIFDDSTLGLGRNPSLGANPAAEAAMVAEYTALYEETLVDAGGDTAVAEKAASDRFRRIYGTSEFSTLGNTVLRYPVEKAYQPGPDGTHDYIRSQGIEALKQEGVTAEDVYLMPLPDGGTEKDIQSRKPARYQLFYKDPESGKVEQFNLPFYADPAVANEQFKEQRQSKIRESEQRMIEERDQAAIERGTTDDAIVNTVGPDWMKARQAETDMERRRMEESRPARRDAPKIGGGGW
ncbi:MAG: hypothetical protein ACK4P4_05490 [Allorhizobium sp.]